MLYLKTCCQRYHYYQYMEGIKKYLNQYLMDVMRKEIYGDDSVQCDYDKINNLMYLKEKLDNMKFDFNNKAIGESMGLDTKTDDEILAKYCLEQTSKYFGNIGVVIEPLLDLYHHGIFGNPIDNNTATVIL